MRIHSGSHTGDRKGITKVALPKAKMSERRNEMKLHAAWDLPKIIYGKEQRVGTHEARLQEGHCQPGRWRWVLIILVSLLLHILKMYIISFKKKKSMQGGSHRQGKVLPHLKAAPGPAQRFSRCGPHTRGLPALLGGLRGQNCCRPPEDRCAVFTVLTFTLMLQKPRRGNF